MYAALEEQYAASEGEALRFTTRSSTTSSQHHQYVSSHLELGGEEGTAELLDNSAAKHKMSVRPQRRKRSVSRQRTDSTGETQEAAVADSSAINEPKKSKHDDTRRSRSGRQAASDPSTKREAVVRELVETEEEFVADMEHVVNVYYRQMDHPSTPRRVSDQRDALFGPFKQIQEFHKSVLLEGLKYYANDPSRLGKTFLRLERDFDKHAQYYGAEPKSQELLKEDKDLREFFEEYSQRIGDTKRLSEYLKLPIQRINDFQVLIQDLISHSRELKEDTSDLEKAHEFMLDLPQKLSDTAFLENISGYRGSIHKLGRLLRHDWWTVTDSRGRSRERYLFLFKARILVTKAKRVTADRNLFLLKDIIRIPDVEVREHDQDEPPSFDLIHSDPRFVRYPLSLRSSSGRQVFQDWLFEIQKYSSHLIALQEHLNDDLQVDGPGETDNEADDVPAPPPPPPPPKPEVKPEVKPEIRIEAKTEPKVEVAKPEAKPEPVKTEPLTGEEDSAAIAKKIKGLIGLRGKKPDESEESVAKPEVVVAAPTVRPEPPSSVTANQTPAPQGDKKSEPTPSAPMADGASEAPAAAAAGADGPSSGPKFIRTIRGVFCEPGEKATFDCSIDGSPHCNVTWLRNNRPLDDRFADRVQMSETGKTHKLVIMNCRPEDSGQYTARAANSEGATSCSAPLVVETLSPEQREQMAKDNSPMFMVRLHDTELIEGSSVHFVIKVRGEPVPSVTFKKNGKTITNSERIKVLDEQSATGFFELLINGVVKEDEGEYSCFALNRFGEVSCSANITVTNDKDLFELLGAQGLLAPGDKPEFKWFKDGAPYDPEERFKVDFKEEEDTLALVFQGVKPEDAGLYTCVAATSTGKISCSAELTVQGAIHHLLKEPEVPTFTVSMGDTEVGAGGSAMLELKYKGFPKPRMVWTKGDEIIKAGGRFRFLYEDEESVALIIKNVDAADAGVYKVTATNDLGEATTEGRLLVKAPPKFKKKVQDMACMTEEQFKMTVEVEGSPAPDIKWYKDGNLVIESERIKIVKESEDVYALVIEKVVIEDSGAYSVVASNTIGQMSEFWHLVTNAKPSFVKGMLKDKEVEENGSINLQVQVFGNPLPAVKWVKDGKELVHDGQNIVIKQEGGNHTLTVNNVKRSDSGKYDCVITNPFGVQQETSDVHIRCKPEIVEPLQDLEARVGTKDVTFTAKASGYPAPKVRWFLDEVEITEERTEYVRKSDHATGTYSLIASEVLPDMSGKYTVQLENDLGSAKSSAILTLQCAPKIEQSIENTVVDEGQSAVFTFKCLALPEASVKWFKDGKEVTASARVKISNPSSGTYSLSIDNCVKEDTGNYTVKVANDLGEKELSASLTIQYKPKILEDNFQLIDIYEEEVIYYKVTFEGVPKPKAEWTLNGVVIEQTEHFVLSETENSYSLHIEEAKLTDAGQFKLKLSNHLGEEVKSAPVTVHPLAELHVPKVIKALHDTQVCKGNQLEMHARVQGIPHPTVEWFKDGEPLKHNKDYVISEDELTHEYFLVLPNAKEVHGGKYSLKASNSNGSDESHCELTILIRPELTHPPDVIVNYFEDTTIEVKVVAIPAHEAKWLKNGAELKVSERVTITKEESSGVHKLTLHKCDSTDEAVYTLVASNTQGETRGDIKLRVKSEAPAFSEEPQSKHVRVGKVARLDGTVTGIPMPSVEWTKNGKPMPESERIEYVGVAKDGEFSLIIKDVELSDFAEYGVRAFSVIGEAKASATLTESQIAPTLGDKLPVTTRGHEGDPLKISVLVDGSPRPDVVWYKDDVEIVPDERIKMETLPDGTAVLFIDPADPLLDNGQYKMVAVNASGKASTHTEVDVKKKPRPAKIITPLDHHIQGVEGRPLKLEVKVAGYPRPEIKWTKDGKQIRPGSHHTAITVLPCGTVSLEIEKCTPEEAGQYSLHASNDQGEDSCEATIEILPPPSAPHFSTPLFPVKATEGFNARLEAKVQGVPPPELTWFKDGHKIHGDYSKKPESGGRVKLDLRNVSRETDPGEYSVTAKNDEGEAETKAKLEVRPRKSDGPESAPHILTPPHDTSVDEGSPIRLWAFVSGNPVADVEWTRNGKPVDPDRSFVWMDGDKVFIEIGKAVKKLDEGEYELVLTNPSGRASAKCRVTVWKVFTPPSFTQRFSDLQQLPNYDAKFMAKIAGQPKPTVTWEFEDKPIATDSDKYKIKRDGELCVLFVRDCSPSRAGKYSCVAKNSEGEDRCEAKLEIVDRIEKREKEEAPSFLKKIGDCEVYEGMTAKFTACAAGFPEPEYEWFRNGVRLHPSERVKMEREGSGLLRLSIKYVDEVDVGQYSLRIFNKVGEATCSGELLYDTLDSKPKKPVGDSYADFDKFRSTKAPVPLADKPIINLINDRYLTLSWKPSLPIGPRTPVTYAVEIKELPDGDWKKIRSGIRGCCCDIRNLDPYLDYGFRIRVENEFGVSEPSPHNSTSRDRLNLVPIPRKRFLEPGETFHPDHSYYFPKDYDLDRPPHEGYTHAPRFLRQETDKQYGVKNQSASLFWYVYGYPKPHVKFYFNDEPIETGGRFDFSYTRNGQLTLFVNKMLDRDAGYYEAVATNPYGEARQRVKLEVAEHPYFIDRPQESVFLTRKSGRVVVRIGGYPECEVKWYKDWAPLAPSSRVKLQHILPDTYVMAISDIIAKDEGLYSIVARNPAGAVSASAMVYVEELEEDYAVRTYQRNKNVKAKSVEVDRLFGNYYDIGDELGRGTQGVTYHSVERASGKSFAAKIMTGSTDEIRKRMLAEMEAMNTLHHERLIRLFDAYETPDNMTLVQELAAGGDLVDSLTKKPFVTESEIAHYVRQLLHGLRHMHENNWAHFGLTPGDLFLSHPDSDDLKIGDFGLARKIINTKLSPLDYGMPEFVAPETANGQGVGLPADMWSVGVITYLFLSGISPFRGDTDKDTLHRVQAGQINFDPDAFSNISADAKDFIAKLLVFHSEGRLTVDEALKHPWLREADRVGREGLYEISTERLKTYYDRHYRDWYANASCRNWYRRRPLSSAFTHPSCMVYPPGEEYTPRSTPAPRERSASVKPEFKSLELPGVDTGLGSSESHYQYGPDTYLLQLRDVDFPVRLRHYMKVASGRSPSFAMHLQTTNPDFTVPVIHERRRFTDIMDEEIDDESRKARRQFNQQHGDGGPLQYYTPNRRLKNELGVRDEAHIEADSILEAKRRGLAPFFREKPKTVAMVDGEAAQLTCLVMGQPAPSVQWFRNDILIVPDRRVTITQKENGLSILKLSPAYVMDCGIYKAVARNKIGQTTAKCRLVIGDVPTAPDSPEASEVSDCEILLRWKVPRHDGNATVLCYCLQQKKAVDSDWTDVAENIDHEFFLVRNLEPDTQYQFRLAARNRFGWSEKSIPTDAIATKDIGSPKVSVTRAMKYLQQLTESRTEPIVPETHEEEAARNVDYSVETEPKEVNTSPPTDDFSFIAEINRGRFSLIAKCSDKEANKMYAAKIVKRDYDTLAELKVAQTLCHERIVSVHQAFDTGSLLLTIMEKLQGIDVLSALSQRHDYNENVVVNIVSQVLDGLQYLHWRGLTHLDLQPDNVLLTSARSLDVKLCDFGCAQRVSKQGTVVEQDRSYLPFTAPEILNGEPAFPQSDIWSLGCLTYVLLSGVSPYAGENDEEIRQNITYVRYRFEPLYKEISMEAQRFIMFVFKRAPFKRPTTEECLEHRWFQPSEHMFKKRERAVFLGNRLKDFSDEYHTQRMQMSTKCDDLLSSFGLGLGRSLSNQTDIFTTY